jgi:hypothetical protein
LKVMGRSSIQKVEVRADGTGLSSRAGTALLPLAGERLGLSDAPGWALAETREPRARRTIPAACSAIWRVMLDDGGRCVSDVVALGSQPALFGEVASVSTARRVLLSVGEAELERVRSARTGRGRWAPAHPSRIEREPHARFAAGLGVCVAGAGRVRAREDRALTVRGGVARARARTPVGDRRRCWHPRCRPQDRGQHLPPQPTSSG